METLRTLIHGHLPPVGQALVLKHQQGLPQLPGFTATWVNSGTAALALALLDAKQRRPQITQPEVLMPAYACPDLISAAQWAGVTPVLLDTQADDICAPLHTLESAITPNTLAVVAVTFLGLRALWLDNLNGLKAKHPQLIFIEDNAQWFFEQGTETPFLSDYVITSFGRGKPVSLLGGGAVFSQHPLQPSTLNSLQPAQHSALYPLKARAYNLLLNPHAYWFLNNNPFIKLGLTQYKPLQQVALLAPQRLALLPANWQAYGQRSRALENHYLHTLSALNGYNTHAGMGTHRHQRLLRMPLLCRSLSQRNGLLQALQYQGLGATALYQKPLITIDGVKDKARSLTPPTLAKDFADRLITLPLHAGVTASHLTRIQRLLAHWNQQA